MRRVGGTQLSRGRDWLCTLQMMQHGDNNNNNNNTGDNIMQ